LQALQEALKRQKLRADMLERSLEHAHERNKELSAKVVRAWFLKGYLP
jgi:hypothetical protein